MFAVKGWSVDASSLKPQTEIYNSNKSQDGEQKKSNKKRKRGHAKEANQASNIRLEDVGQLWEQHVEGRGVSNEENKRASKKQKLDRKHEERTKGDEVAGGVSKSKDASKMETSEGVVNGSRKDKSNRPEGNKKHRQKVKEIAVSADDTKPNDSNGKAHEQDTAAAKAPETPRPSTLTPMQSAMRQKLISARFRHLNQTLYTEPSSKAQELFDENPDMFEDYHTGFRQQVSVWPQNPLDTFIAAIRERGKIKPPPRFAHHRGKANAKPPPSTTKDPVDAPLPRTHGTSIIADLGCGDARLAQTLTLSGETNRLNLKILSYDLHSPSPYVTKADISNLPLENDSVDIAIFCLALMGTNWISFVEEANRVLHWKGELWVAEIKSRFGRQTSKSSNKPVGHSVGKRKPPAASTKASEAKAREQEELHDEAVLQTEVDGVASTSDQETDVAAFVQVLKRRGFLLKPPSEKSIDLRNKMFVKMQFVKAVAPIKGKGKKKAERDDSDGKGGASSNLKKKLKFVDEGEEDVETDEETGVLKPCLYKIR